VIVVPVTKDERIDRGRIDTEQAQVRCQGPGRVAEVDQYVANIAAALRFDMHRQTEFAYERLLRGTGPKAPAEALDRNVVGDRIRRNRELNVVGNDSNGDAIDFRNRERFCEARRPRCQWCGSAQQQRSPDPQRVTASRSRPR